ncbi:MAG: hypothetical protein V7629_06235 [Motiliproteus sp.]
MLKNILFFKIVSALIFGFTVSTSSIASPAVGFEDFSQLNVYGVQRPGLSSVSEARDMLEDEITRRGELSAETKEELHRFLLYDALNHYVAFLLHATNKPDSDYFAGFSPLRDILQDDFTPIHYDAAQKAVEITKKIRFDVTIVMLSIKHIYNAGEGTAIDADIVTLLSRLEKISTKVKELYPASNGELPTALIAFVTSVFSPVEDKQRATCDQHLPDQLKSQVLRILATGLAESEPETFASPVTSTQSMLKERD